MKVEHLVMGFTVLLLLVQIYLFIFSVDTLTSDLGSSGPATYGNMTAHIGDMGWKDLAGVGVIVIGALGLWMAMTIMPPSAIGRY